MERLYFPFVYIIYLAILHYLLGSTTRWIGWLVDWLVGRLGGDVYRDLDKLMDRRKRGITWGARGKEWFCMLWSGIYSIPVFVLLNVCIAEWIWR